MACVAAKLGAGSSSSWMLGSRDHASGRRNELRAQAVAGRRATTELPKLFVERPSSTGPAMRTKTTTKKPLNFAQKIADKVIDVVERNLELLHGQQEPLPSTVDPLVQLEGNFSPVAEQPACHDLEVEGNLPGCLEGVYVRNGPNPQFAPTGRHHLFDGDGMLHAVSIHADGSVSYACRYTRTYRFMEEARQGRAFFPKPIGELHGYGGVARLLAHWTRSLCGILDASQGMGVANAGLVWFNKRLLAISEDDLPVEVRMTENDDIETVGRYDFHGQLAHSMIAHPKIDPATGELFSLSYNVLSAPYLKYLIFGPDGEKKNEVPVTLPEAAMTHDFAITENFVVIPDQQIVFRLKEMLTGGSPVVLDPKKTPRFGIMPKYATSEEQLLWIEVPNCFFFHLYNAWEEGDEVVVIGSSMTPADIIFKTSEVPRALFTEVRLNRVTGKSSKRELCSLNLEVGKMNLNYVGKKTQFMYLAIVEPWPKVSGIAKVDVQSGDVVARYNFGPDRFGGEPVFVPRGSGGTAEDDGYLLAFCHDEHTGLSELLVLDAASPTLARVASVKLPSRVPYGFHGAFIPAQDLLQAQ
uniref:Nine-cis-epoxycarotenoid dioxygenase 3 n=1 Tax=Pohlia nutans TaxID=140635 RepID=A0A4D6QFT3_9BRYO|nr:nine-cis-epoxycarotenoid dioxygenase 3 [Pohlia nutans]